METCDYQHVKIAYDMEPCPLCGTKDEIADIEAENEREYILSESKIDDLRAKIKDLQDEIDGLVDECKRLERLIDQDN